MMGKRGNIFPLAGRYVLLALFFVFTVFPFLWLLLTSLKGSRELYEFPVRYLPREATLGNYREVIQMGDFGRYICNSLTVALAGACLVVLIAGMSSYILSRMEFKSKPAVFMIFMMTQMLPSAVGFAPLYILMTRLGMVDRLSTVILILAGGQIPFGTILLIGFMKGIPKALEESALLDGCGRVKTFFLIVMPLAKAGLFSVFIFVFLACWNDVYTSVLYINANARKTLTVAIYSMIGKYDINWGNVAAGTLIAMAPAILLFSFMKEIFVENIAGAVKE
ncbi:carbohydrate ABC transporter permease [uncultured Acetatifactor sp.]|jgi:multiple sugar transport system permease protein|uniref:carbohydrate ABC transporter permease n=1 Tax=uncultured Acetatifactor sp. TaxID=1671927 RepID=UPI00260C0727|nr:carbohydrate ABC transporter permease [uncultured Acetatifactor sp.]